MAYKSRCSLLLFLFLPATALAQQNLDSTAPAAVTPVASTSDTFLSTHFKVQQLEQVERFNYQDHASTVNDREGQYRLRARIRINLDDEGKTSITFRAETGQGFNNSWNNSGPGLNGPQWNFFMKTLTLAQQVGSHVTLEAGGLEFDQGAGSQTTYASGDSAFVGYRFRWRGSDGNLPTRFSITTGFVGGFSEGSMFSRFNMGKLNYVQVLAQKGLASNLVASLQFDSLQDIHYFRPAAIWSHVPVPFADSLMLEGITRTTDKFRAGWAATVDKDLGARKLWHAQVIYSDVPTGFYFKNGQPVLQNRGEIDQGKRVSVGLSHKLASNLEAGLFMGRLVDSSPNLRHVFQAYVAYDYASLVRGLLAK